MKIVKEVKSKRNKEQIVDYKKKGCLPLHDIYHKTSVELKSVTILKEDC